MFIKLPIEFSFRRREEKLHLFVGEDVYLVQDLMQLPGQRIVLFI